MLPKEKEAEGILMVNGFPANTKLHSDIEVGYNQALSEVHALVPAIIEKVYEELRGKREALECLDTVNIDNVVVKQNVVSRRDVLSLLSTKK